MAARHTSTGHLITYRTGFAVGVRFAAVALVRRGVTSERYSGRSVASRDATFGVTRATHVTGHVRCVAIEASTASRIVQTLDTATRGNRTEANFGGRKGCAITVRTALERVCVRLTSRAKARIASASGTDRFVRGTSGCSRVATTRRDRRDNAGFRGVVRNVVIRHAASAHDGRQESQCTSNAKLRYTQRGHDMSITLLSQASR